MMTDPIADMLTRIRNAQRARKKTAVVPLSKLKLRIAEILLAEKYIEALHTDATAKPALLVLTLKYSGKDPAIRSIKRESKPGFRMYRSADEILSIASGYGISILSTSKGLMTNREARKQGIGGEIICSVF